LLLGQGPSRFEVATVKPSNLNVRNNGAPRTEGNGFSAVGIPLIALITQAYRDQLGLSPIIEGGPAWIRNDRFDVIAAAPGPRDIVAMGAMLRSLLADRFGLKAHTETRDQNVYALVPARKDGKLGSKVKPFPETCFGNPAPPRPSSPRLPRCAAVFRNGIEITGGTMAVVADTLSNPLTGLGRVVLDRTGIPGEFDMQLDFDYNAQDPRNPNRQDALLGPSLFTALEEQWGLKFEPAKAMVTILVIDQATLPTDN
jgi:uncharacterized protein (TIGR03435 family)